MEFFLKESVSEHDIPVYFTDEYNKIFSAYDNAEYRVLEILKNGKKIFFPFLMFKTDNFYEAYTSYGYGGFFGEYQETFTDYEFEEIKNFFKNNGIIDVFIRNTPFLKNEIFIPDSYNFFNRVTYTKNLKRYDSFEKLKSKVGQKVRWSVNYALRNGLEVIVKKYSEINDNDIKLFYNLYTKVMDFRNTTDYYYFPENFFRDTFSALKDKCDMYFIEKDGKFIAASLFIKDSIVHYHFSATDRDYSKFQPMELLMLRAIYNYGNEGYKALHLGGGLSSDCSDGLSKFKKKFSDNENKFFISKIICDPETYYDSRKKLISDNNNMFLIKDALI